MNIAKVRLTVYFEDPFWIGVFERVENGGLSACKVTFGAEPRDSEVFAFVQRYYYKLKFSSAVEAEKEIEHKNPKRILREARQQTAATGIGTKSQQALKKQYEESKIAHKKESKEHRDAEKEQKFLLRQKKKKEKHKGR